MPRLEFQRQLRQRLIDEALLLASQPKTRPRSGRPRRPRGGGIRLAAIGIGFSLAGGGVVAAAHSLTLPPKPGAAADGPSAASPRHPPAQARSPAPAATGPMISPARRDDPTFPLTPATAAVATPPASSSPLPASPPAAVTGTPPAATVAVGTLADGRFPTAVASDPSSLPPLLPSWPDPLPRLSAGSLPLQSPLR